MPYTMGQVVRVSATFTDPDTESLYDPATVTIETLAPGASSAVTQSSVRDSLGQWHADFTVDTPGQWWARVVTSVPTDAAERTFVVNSSLFPGA